MEEMLKKSSNVGFSSAFSVSSGIILTSISNKNEDINNFAGHVIPTTGVLLILVGILLGFYSAYLAVNSLLKNQQEHLK